MFRIILAAAMPLALAGCAAATSPADVMPVPSPADSDAGIRTLRHSSVLDGYTHRLPVEPKPWRQSNDSQAPGAGGGS